MKKERQRRAPKARKSRRRGGGRGAQGTERGGLWGGGVPLLPGDGAGEGTVLPPHKHDFGCQYGEFWCILDGIFYSSATCFTRETGVKPL